MTRTSAARHPTPKMNGNTFWVIAANELRYQRVRAQSIHPIRRPWARRDGVAGCPKIPSHNARIRSVIARCSAVLNTSRPSDQHSQQNELDRTKLVELDPRKGDVRQKRRQQPDRRAQTVRGHSQNPAGGRIDDEGPCKQQDGEADGREIRDAAPPDQVPDALLVGTPRLRLRRMLERVLVAADKHAITGDDGVVVGQHNRRVVAETKGDTVRTRSRGFSASARAHPRSGRR